nr:hypothetical protein [Tanacetum cinerariifolium]
MLLLKCFHPAQPGNPQEINIDSTDSVWDSLLFLLQVKEVLDLLTSPGIYMWKICRSRLPTDGSLSVPRELLLWCGAVSGLHWGARVNIAHGIALALAYLPNDGLTSWGH